MAAAPKGAGEARGEAEDVELIRAIGGRLPAGPGEVARARQAAEAALTELVRRYGRRLRAYVRRWVPDAGTAEEVLQDVWLAVWQGAAGFRGDGPAAGWLFRIAHRKALDAGRRRRPESPLDELPEEPNWHSLAGAATAAGDPERRLLGRERVRRLVEAVRRLPPEQRATLQLVLVERLPLEEVARVMGCPEGTVKSRLRRARLRLAAELEEGEP